MKKVKRCPFCGKMPVVFPFDPIVSGDDSWGAVMCWNIRCHAQPVVRCDAKVTDNRGSDKYKKTAIRRWNKRYEG
jgi:hypothetical protein